MFSFWHTHKKLTLFCSIVPLAVLSRKRINAEKKKAKELKEEEEAEEARKKEAGKYQRVYKYRKLVKAARRKLDGVIILFTFPNSGLGTLQMK